MVLREWPYCPGVILNVTSDSWKRTISHAVWENPVGGEWCFAVHSEALETKCLAVSSTEAESFLVVTELYMAPTSQKE